MSNLKLVKAKLKHPSTKETGYIARVQTTGTADYEELVSEACRNTTLHRTEAKMALELCMETVVELLRKGRIVDLGPVGKLYPTCSSKFVRDADELTDADVNLSVHYRPDKKTIKVIKGTMLQWVHEETGTAEE